MKVTAYHRPRSLEEAAAQKASSPHAAFVAGATDLFVAMRRGGGDASELISLRSVPELGVLEATDDALRIGAAVPVADVAAHPVARSWFPALVRALGSLGCRQIRNVATIGGNLCRAAPCADSAPPLLVHDAEIEIASLHGSRTVPIASFFRGPGQTVLGRDEILVAVRVPRPPRGTHAAFLRKSRVRMDLSLASLAVLLVLERGRCRLARVAAGSVAPVPMRLLETERILAGSDLGEEALARARRAASEEVAPITDLRSTAEYRRHVIGVFLERAVREAIAPERRA